ADVQPTYLENYGLNNQDYIEENNNNSDNTEVQSNYNNSNNINKKS
ncbi:6603_t:CDS:2, partial [Gigaspora margarita]